jgi:general transcription factor 3C polypeptide 2
MCVTAEFVPIRALSWAPYIRYCGIFLMFHFKNQASPNLNSFYSDENINTFVTAGADGLKFWDLRYVHMYLRYIDMSLEAYLSHFWLSFTELSNELSLSYSFLIVYPCELYELKTFHLY